MGDVAAIDFEGETLAIALAPYILSEHIVSASLHADDVVFSNCLVQDERLSNILNLGNGAA